MTALFGRPTLWLIPSLPPNILFKLREELCQVCAVGQPSKTPFVGHDGDVCLSLRSHDPVSAQRLEQQALSGRCCHLPPLPPNALADGADARKTCKKQLDAALRTYWQEQRMATKQQKQNDIELEQKCASEAIHAAQGILDERLGLKNIPHCRWSSPPLASVGCGVPCRQLHSCFDSSRVAHVTQNPSEDVETLASNVFVGQLAGDWRKRHECIPQTSRAQPSKSLTSRCFQLGVCTCKNAPNPRRSWLKKLIEKASQHIKRLQRSASINKELKNGHLILRWLLTEARAVPKQPTGAMSSTDPLPQPPPKDVVEKWTHIPLHYQTPWSPTLLELSVAAGEEAPPWRCQTVAPANLKLQACKLGQSFRLFSLSEWIDHIVGKDTVEVELWQLSERHRPCQVGGMVYACRHPGANAATIWTSDDKADKPLHKRREPVPLHELYEDCRHDVGQRKARKLAHELRRPQDRSNATLLDLNPVVELEGDSEAGEESAGSSLDMEVQDDSQEDNGEGLIDATLGALEAAAVQEGGALECVDHNAVAETTTAAATTATDQLEGSTAQATAVPDAGTLANPGRWGHFRFSRKQPTGVGPLAYGGYEVTCPYHVLSKAKKSLCKKFVACAGDSVLDHQQALRMARFWASQAREHKYQFQHIREAAVEDPPSFDVLETKRPKEEPRNIKDDAEMLAEETAEEQQRLEASRRGRGKGRGRGRGKAKPAPVPKAAAAPPAAAAEPSGSSATSSSDSDNSSSSSSS
eukprot:6464163-Amphidinium_carterae.1